MSTDVRAVIFGLAATALVAAVCVALPWGVRRTTAPADAGQPRPEQVIWNDQPGPY